MMFSGLLVLMAVTAALATCWPLFRQSPSRGHIAIALFIIAGSVGLYTSLGSPHLTGQQVSRAEVDGILDKLKKHLDQNQTDVQGWRMLGWSYFKLQKWPEATAALQKARALDAKDSETRTLLLQAMVQDQRQITPQIKDLISEILALDPGNVVALQTKAQIEKMTTDTGKPPAISADQRPMIEAMVARLAGKLKDNPNDVDGWLKLIRSYDVLGDEPKRREAIMTALKSFPTDSADLARIKEATSKYGLD